MTSRNVIGLSVGTTLTYPLGFLTNFYCASTQESISKWGRSSGTYRAHIASSKSCIAGFSTWMLGGIQIYLLQGPCSQCQHNQSSLINRFASLGNFHSASWKSPFYKAFKKPVQFTCSGHKYLLQSTIF